MADKARDYALRLLSVRDRSRKELEDRMRTKGFKKSDIKSVISSLRKSGLLDDAQFAASFVRAKAHRMWGPKRILFELLKKGVRESTARKALARYYDEESVRARAISKAAKLLHQHADLDERHRTKKVYDYFARRGHNSDFIMDVLEASLGAFNGQQ